MVGCGIVERKKRIAKRNGWLQNVMAGYGIAETLMVGCGVRMRRSESECSLHVLDARPNDPPSAARTPPAGSFGLR